ncbi:GntR family transcriptional regulator [Mesorhizobium sp. CU2]|uniref:GntR family transcriptional regulator n=1 Tax=unclassified Mesorhizobium TaxID=325217 RepID=UPI00112C5F14|nr:MULTISPECIES: GntR family transcriptional regulator [unclassified Mesorhizobium]TPN85667.1 GntR family transcriptional regulator [Mesorhizobium sp. CU3]TPO11024.1 GntR family transcriptional regulator [Mesorhizobium sp. CU2]
MKNRTRKPAASRGGRATSVPTKNLTEQAYEQIKEKLISAQYVPGQFLQETQVSSDLGLGRTPVHQALHRLQQEGLVEIIPRKGVLVRSDSLSEIFLALEARALVEPYCAAQCAEKIRDHDLVALKEIYGSYEALRDSANTTKLMELDRQFHVKVAEATGNRLLADFLKSIHERMSRIWFLPLWQFHDFKLTGNEHGSLLAAIVNRDPKAAAEAMSAHIESLRRRIMEAGPG